MDKKYIIIIAVVALLLAGILISANTGEVNTVQLREGYKEIHDIDGAVFHMNQKLLDMATAITQISNESHLDESSFYIYKNGHDQYILFNMNKIVVLVQKGTSFGFDKAENLENALKSASICNIWFDKSGKKLEITNSGSTYYANVNAEITITKELYGDFTGRLVSTSLNGQEWSIFVGIPGNNYEKITDADIEIVESIANSLKAIETEEGYVEEIEEEVAETKVIEEKPTEEPVAEETENDREKVTEEDTASEDIVNIVEDAMDKTVMAADDAEKKENLPEKQVGIGTVNNQKKKKEIVGKAYKSDIYSLLSIKESGLLSAFNYESEAYETATITIKKIFTGKEAEKLIKANLQNGEYFDAKDGSSYHAVVYNVDYTGCIGTPYINIKLKGLDGDTLKYRGIKYTKKTHDIDSNIKVNNQVISNYICYYEVPNGCKEYVLECGDGTISNDEEIMAAYYKITVD